MTRCVRKASARLVSGMSLPGVERVEERLELRLIRVIAHVAAIEHLHRELLHACLFEARPVFASGTCCRGSSPRCRRDACGNSTAGGNRRPRRTCRPRHSRSVAAMVRARRVFVRREDRVARSAWRSSSPPPRSPSMQRRSASSAWQPAVSSALPPSSRFGVPAVLARTTARCRGSNRPRRSGACRRGPHRAPPWSRGIATTSGTQSRRRPSRPLPPRRCFIARISLHSIASGFSTMMCLPARAAAMNCARVLIRVAGDVDDVDRPDRRASPRGLCRS